MANSSAAAGVSGDMRAIEKNQRGAKSNVIKCNENSVTATASRAKRAYVAITLVNLPGTRESGSISSKRVNSINSMCVNGVSGGIDSV